MKDLKLKVTNFVASHPTFVSIAIGFAISTVIALGIAAITDPSHMANAAIHVRRGKNND